MSKANNSKNWIKGHVKDPFVIQAQKDGYRSRAAYKLIEIDKKYKIIKSGITAVDLGAAPGGWSQVLTKKIGLKGKVVGIDLLEVAPIKGIDFIQGDFMQEEILNEMVDKLENKPVDLVISDMAPNISGIKMVDQQKAIYLNELAFDFASSIPDYCYPPLAWPLTKNAPAWANSCTHFEKNKKLRVPCVFSLF